MSELLIGRPVDGLRRLKRVQDYSKGVKLIEKKSYNLIVLNLDGIDLSSEQIKELVELLDKKDTPTLIIGDHLDILHLDIQSGDNRDYLEVLPPELIKYLLEDMMEKLNELGKVREELALGLFKTTIAKFTNLFKAAQRVNLGELVLIRVGEEIFEATLANISETGALIETRANLSVLAHLDMTLHNAGELSKLPAFVVRSQQSRIEGRTGLTGFGLRFHLENRSDKRLLKNFVNSKLAA